MTQSLNDVPALEKARDKLNRLAWLTTFISLLTGISHERSFPSYNAAVSVIALYVSNLLDIDALRRGIAVCAIMCLCSIGADITFCSLWAREVSAQTSATQHQD